MRNDYLFLMNLMFQVEVCLLIFRACLRMIFENIFKLKSV